MVIGEKSPAPSIRQLRRHFCSGGFGGLALVGPFGLQHRFIELADGFLSRWLFSTGKQLVAPCKGLQRHSWRVPLGLYYPVHIGVATPNRSNSPPPPATGSATTQGATTAHHHLSTPYQKDCFLVRVSFCSHKSASSCVQHGSRPARRGPAYADIVCIFHVLSPASFWPGKLDTRQPPLNLRRFELQLRLLISRSGTSHGQAMALRIRCNLRFMSHGIGHRRNQMFRTWEKSVTLYLIEIS